SIAPTIEDLNFLDWSSGIPVPRYTNPRPHIAVPQGQLPTSPVGQSLIPPARCIPAPLIQQNRTQIVQLLTPPDESRVGTSTRARPGGPMTPGQASLFDSIFSLADDPPVLLHTPESPGSSSPNTGTEQSADIGRGHNPDSHQTEPTVDAEHHDHMNADDPGNLQVGLLNELALDREVESNIIPFLAHCLASWISRFTFEPIRALSLARDAIIRGHTLGEEIRQRMILVANTVLAISKSTDYELTYFATLYKQVVKGLLEARACSNLTREAAMRAMESCHEFFSMASKVASLANILNLMEMYAPVFRRACPESGEELVNLPRSLTAAEVRLKYYVSFDVVLSVITHRPMFFRYDLHCSPHDDELLDADDKPGLGWSIGVCDRLVFILAKMNTLLEDYGNGVDQGVVRELGREIGAYKPIVSSGAEDDLTLKIRRLVVQESWRLAAYVYLYMGLCGADSRDARVVKVQKQFMKLLATIKPRRNPDAFLITPMTIMGIATASPADRSTLRTRLRGVTECSKMGTMANDLTSILYDVWARTVERPTVWSDLRMACLKITGM
ncbi:hypothetical protein FRC11_004978, partial [Ceratobasidium sp. 423]